MSDDGSGNTDEETVKRNKTTVEDYAQEILNTFSGIMNTSNKPVLKSNIVKAKTSLQNIRQDNSEQIAAEVKNYITTNNINAPTTTTKVIEGKKQTILSIDKKSFQ